MIVVNNKMYIVYTREGCLYDMTYDYDEAIKMLRRMNEEG